MTADDIALIAPDNLESLLARAGLSCRGASVQHCETGGNNVLYRVYAGNRVYALKKYKRSDGDRRDRLGAEWAFLSAVHQAIPDAPVPAPLAFDREAGVALYDFIEGRKPGAEDVDFDHIRQAARFIRTINEAGIRAQAGNLLPASEAAFSMQGHFDILQERLKRLDGFEMEPEFRDALNIAAARLYENFEACGLDLRAALPPDERCLSPSDFGFHNALLDGAGALTFIDFEYAGWDDPAKLCADFFFQPQIPADGKYYDFFLTECLAYLPEEKQIVHKRRAQWLRPLFGLRWCCIILNPFDPSWAEKQGGAQGYPGKVRQERLAAGKRLLNRVEEMIERSF